jgi:broad specificity phosphatase PhoE
MMWNMDPTKECVGYLIRHGELTRMNIWDGWGPYNLSEEGKQQAEKAAQWLSFERIGRAISSDLPRSMRTAEALMDTGAVLCPYLATDPNMRPRKVGAFEGKEKTPERLAQFMKYIEDPNLEIPDGESSKQLHERVQVIFQYAATPYKGLPTCFFVHNSVIKSLMGMDNVENAVDPGGIVAMLMDEKGDFSFQIVLGYVEPQQGIS